MPSTYSETARLEMMADGEKVGIWGQITNRNLKLIEQLVSATSAIAITDADYILPIAYGDTTGDQARAAMLDITGALTAKRKIVAPDGAKVYIVRNKTAGGFAIDVGGAIGSVVTVPNGYSKIVVLDGLGHAFDFTESLAVSGNTKLTTLQATETTLTDLTVNGPAETTGNLTVGGNGTVDGKMFVAGGEVWTNINDGPLSGLEADLLDGAHLADILTYVDAAALAVKNGTVANSTKFDNKTYAQVKALWEADINAVRDTIVAGTVAKAMDANTLNGRNLAQVKSYVLEGINTGGGGGGGGVADYAQDSAKLEGKTLSQIESELSSSITQDIESSISNGSISIGLSDLDDVNASGSTNQILTKTGSSNGFRSIAEILTAEGITFDQQEDTPVTRDQVVGALNNGTTKGFIDSATAWFVKAENGTYTFPLENAIASLQVDNIAGSGGGTINGYMNGSNFVVTISGAGNNSRNFRCHLRYRRLF